MNDEFEEFWLSNDLMCNEIFMISSSKCLLSGIIYV